MTENEVRSSIFYKIMFGIIQILTVAEDTLKNNVPKLFTVARGPLCNIAQL